MLLKLQITYILKISMKTWQKLRQFLTTDFGVCLTIVIAWQCVLTLIGWIVTGGLPLAHMSNWDGGWYLTVARDWYHTSAPSAAFYPLFPLLVSVVHFAGFGLLSLNASGFIINTLALWLGLVALVKIAPYFVAKRYQYLPVLFILAAPAAFFMHLFYTEAVFFCISAWAYLLALQRRWWVASIMLALLTACRLPALLIIGLCILEYLRAHDWNMKRALNKNAYAFLLAPAGFIAYGAYLTVARGSFFAMFSAYHASDDWVYQVFNPNILLTIARALYQPLRALLGLRDFDHELVVNNIIPLLALALLATTSVYAVVKLKKKFLPLGIIGLLSIVMFTLNSNVVSAHRYILPSLVIYLVGAYIFEKHKKTHPYIIVGVCLSFLVQAFLYISFLQGKFAG